MRRLFQLAVHPLTAILCCFVALAAAQGEDGRSTATKRSEAWRKDLLVDLQDHPDCALRSTGPFSPPAALRTSARRLGFVVRALPLAGVAGCCRGAQIPYDIGKQEFPGSRGGDVRHIPTEYNMGRQVRYPCARRHATTLACHPIFQVARPLCLVTT